MLYIWNVYGGVVIWLRIVVYGNNGIIVCFWNFWEFSLVLIVIKLSRNWKECELGLNCWSIFFVLIYSLYCGIVRIVYVISVFIEINIVKIWWFFVRFILFLWSGRGIFFLFVVFFLRFVFRNLIYYKSFFLFFFFMLWWFD